MRRPVIGILIAIGLGAIAATAAVMTWSGQDEVPIIVRDGSMIIESEGSFDAIAGNAFRHRSNGAHGKAFWVKVVTKAKTAACNDLPKGGKQVVINYSTAGFQATFDVDPAGNDAATTVTKITPRNGTFTLVRTGGKPQLKYPKESDGGRIQSVAVGQQSCSIPDNLVEIRICSSAARTECQ